jgi:hypothetical protein
MKSGIIEKMTIPTNIHVPEVIAIPGVDNPTKNLNWFRHRQPLKKASQMVHHIMLIILLAGPLLPPNSDPEIPNLSVCLEVTLLLVRIPFGSAFRVVSLPVLPIKLFDIHIFDSFGI